MAAVHGKVTEFVGLTYKKEGTSNSLDGDREIKRRKVK